MTSLKKQSYKAFAWDFAGRIGGQTVGFVISIFLARLLSPDDFGLLAMVNVVIALSGSLMDMGLGVALIQRKEVTDAHYGSVFYFNLVVGLILSALLFFAAPLIGLFYNNQQLIPMARAMSVLFILNSIGNVIRLRLRKELEYGIPTQAGLLGAIVSGALGVWMAFNGFGVWSLVAQSLLNPVINNIWLFYKVKWRPKLLFQWQSLKELWGFGFRMFISGILDTIFTNADSIIIGKLFSPATLGYYFRARSLNNYVVQYSSGSLMSVLFPAFSKVQDDIEKFKNMAHKGYHLINFMAFMLTGLFFVIGEDLIILMFGDKWQPSIPMFQLIIIIAFGYPLSSILVNILSATGNSRAFLRLEVIKKIFFGSSLAIGFIWGIHGYLACNAIAYALAVCANIFFAAKQLQVTQWWFYRVTLPYLITTVVIAGVLTLAQHHLKISHATHLIIGTSLFCLLYLITTWLFRIQGLTMIANEVMQLQPLQKIMSKIKR